MTNNKLPEWWRSERPWIIGDCIEVMNRMPDECIDLVVTDPPFNVGIDYGYTTDDDVNDDEYSNWIYDRLIEMKRIVKKGHPVIMFSGDKKIHSIMDAVEKSGLQFHHFIKWNKPGCQRALSGFVLFNRTELAFLLTKGKPEQQILNRKELYSDTLIYKNTSSRGGDDINAVDHPCRRPSMLYLHLIKGFTNEGDIVFDPFLGSGTTILSSIIGGRIGLGCEINPDYEEIIRNRSMDNIMSLDDFME